MFDSTLGCSLGILTCYDNNIASTVVLGGTGLVLANASLRVAPVTVVSPYHYIQIIGGAVAGYMIWHRMPALSVVIGAIMIVASGLYVLHTEKAKSKVFANISSSQPSNA